MPPVTLHLNPEPRIPGPPTVDPRVATRPLARDTAIPTIPPDARHASAKAVGAYIAEQLRSGRSLFNVIGDRALTDLVGADGRARVTRRPEPQS